MNSTNDLSAAPETASLDEWFTLRRFALGLLAFLVAAFPQVWLGEQTFFFRDFGVLGYPFTYFHHDQFAQGNYLPLWNPYSNCGAPFLAQWGTMTLYPGSLVYLLLPMPWSVNVFCLLHLLLGGVGMYQLAHHWTANRFAASMAGFTFICGGFALSSLQWPNYMVAIGWLPWILLTVERAWQQGGRWTIAAVLAASMQMLAGVPEFVIMTWLLIGALLLVQLLQKQAPPKAISRMVLVVILVSGLCAVQLLPFMDLLTHSQRQGGFTAEKWAVPWWGWANAIVPLFHFVEAFDGTMFQKGQSFLSTYYFGLPVLLLAILGLWRTRDARVRVLAGAALLAFWLALGQTGILYGILQKVLPFLTVGRYPVKFVLITAFCLPLLAAFGTCKLLQWKADKQLDRAFLRVGATVGGLMVVLLIWLKLDAGPTDRPAEAAINALVRLILLGAILWGWRQHLILPSEQGRLYARLGVFVLIAADMLTHLPGWNPTLPKDFLAPNLSEQRQAEAPLPQLGEGRIMITPPAEQALLRSRIEKHEDNVLGKRLAQWSNMNVLDHVPKVNGSSTLRIKEQSDIEKLIYAEDAEPVGEGLPDFLAVTHQTSELRYVDWVKRDTALPLITAGTRYEFADAETTLAAVQSTNFNPREVVYLQPESGTLSKGGKATDATVSDVEFGTDRIRFQVTCEEPTVAVIAQTHHHPWRATVNGKPSPVFRANHAFQAVLVSPGESVIELTYRDPAFARGKVLSIVTLVLLAGLWVLPLVRKKLVKA